ncbi:MAG TPA: M15 family metallopeptidase [Aeromicrobium sp.]|nr:M15 family metallopeptidase [Aeromicrobium sp.]
MRLVFWGFDGRRHTGELLVNADAADAMVQVFGRLYAAHFPLEEMRITRAEELDAEPTGDGNNTSAFTCRPLPGTTTWSEHAYGRAVDVNPFQNPYIKPPNAKGIPGDMLIPELASAYLDRSRQAPGMIRPGDPVVQAFASVNWQWGGAWQKSKDYMHFSANGR